MGNIFLPEPDSNTTLLAMRHQDVSSFYVGRQANNLQVRLFGQVVSIVLLPTISLVGIICNVLTAQITVADGLNKSYNILILALAVADSIFLTGVNNVVFLLCARRGSFELRYPENLALFLYIIYHFQSLMDFYGRYLSMTLPVLITSERFVAVYFPLRFASIVTPYRTKISVFLLGIIPLPIFAYFCAMYRFGYLLNPATNTTAGYLVRSGYLIGRYDEYAAISEAYFGLSGPLPNVIVLIGCVAIMVKIKLTIASRKNLFMSPFRGSQTSPKGNNAKPRKPCSSNAEYSKESCQGASRSAKDIVSLPVVELLNGKPISRTDLGRAETKIFMEEVAEIGKDRKESDQSKQSDRRNLRPSTCELCAPAGRLVGHVCAPKTDTLTSLDQAKVLTPKTSQTRTTLMLVSSCAIYTFMVSFKNIPYFILSNDDLMSNTGHFIDRCSQLGICVNSASNFFVYLIFNRRYRRAVKELLRCKE